MGAIEEMESAQGGWLFLSGGPGRLLLAVRGEVAKPERSDDGPSAGHLQERSPREERPLSPGKPADPNRATTSTHSEARIPG